MVFIETPVFTGQVKAILSEDEYRELQTYLASNPTAGDVIQGTGGLRKIRWGAKGKGKRGGARAIYFHRNNAHQIYMVFLFSKNQSSDLTQAQKKALSALVETLG
ncbi:MAG: hypothetical protein AMXMBFR59_40870 [Rhodanobacteraceae bacterium]